VAPSQRVARTRLAGAKKKRQQGKPAAAPEEFATPFFALPFSDASLPLDQARVIRVELPGSALSLAGLPVAEGLRSENVHADVVVGADGLARAIRVVR
jgi:hypothetical protein